MSKIKLRCDRCGNEVMAPRAEYDPCDAVVLHTAFCIKCERSGEFETSYYLDENGKELPL